MPEAKVTFFKAYILDEHFRKILAEKHFNLKMTSSIFRSFQIQVDSISQIILE